MKLKFYDLKARKPFLTDKYAVSMKSGRRFAVAKTPSGSTAYRILPKR
jgi:hypothetical protein